MSVILKSIRSIPTYIWTFTALLSGITLGGLLPDTLSPIAAGTTQFIRIIVMFVPILIFAALSPAVAHLVNRGLAGKFASSVILWYIFSSSLAGFFGLLVSSIIFHIPLTTESAGALSETAKMLKAITEQSSASLPLVAIIAAIAAGIAAVRIKPFYSFLMQIEKAITRMGSRLGYVLIPVILCLGVSIGVKFGALLGMEHYLTMTLYTFVQCIGWWLVYIFIIIKLIAQRPLKKLLTEYFMPTAIFAAGTCSSLATLPVNLAAVKKYGVREEIADFVVPFGAVANMDASALMYVAYAPFVLSYIYNIEISWLIMLIAWPAIVLFTIAAPGLPAGMGTALWSATLFASMLGMEEPVKSSFITTWIALSGGLPDMARTATNCTGDGFTAVLFDRFFDRFFAKSSIH